MVNVHMKNEKLVERGIGVLQRVTGVDREMAIRTIKSAGKSIPIAVVMLKANVDKMEAVRRLQRSDGNVRRAIENAPLDL
jgi:N-acetylmuramic acid 6-phosphate etherase